MRGAGAADAGQLRMSIMARARRASIQRSYWAEVLLRLTRSSTNFLTWGSLSGCEGPGTMVMGMTMVKP